MLVVLARCARGSVGMAASSISNCTAICAAPDGIACLNNRRLLGID
jgi:hypothetical protein